VVPHSNQAVVRELLGLTDPFKVTVVWVIEEADPVSTVGGKGRVVKVWSTPREVPPLF
jgi:hypothetical protein